MRIFSLILLAVILVSCQPSPKPSVDLSDDEYAVINLALRHLVIPADGYKTMALSYNKFPRFPPPLTAAQSRQLQIDYKKSYDSLKSALDTAKLYVSVCDSLMGFPGNYLAQINKNSMAGLSAENYKNPALVKKIAQAVKVNTTPLSFNSERLKPIDTYHFVFYKSYKKRMPRLNGPGHYFLSRVCFDKENTTACLFAENYCGSLCGGGYLIFLIKANGQWRIMDQHQVWVS